MMLHFNCLLLFLMPEIFFVLKLEHLTIESFPSLFQNSEEKKQKKIKINQNTPSRLPSLFKAIELMFFRKITFYIILGYDMANGECLHISQVITKNRTVAMLFTV